MPASPQNVTEIIADFLKNTSVGSCYDGVVMETSKNRFSTTFAEYFKEVIYGGIDGIVTTFAVVAGFAGSALSTDQTTQLSFTIVLLFGLANLFADAASMGLGNFLSVRSEKDLYRVERERELAEIRSNTEAEIVETLTILKARGFSDADAAILVRTYQNNEEYWLDFMMQHEHQLPDPRSENEVYTGLATFLAFMMFGSIPLLPFIIEMSADAATVFMYSCFGTFFALVVLGLLKWKVVGGKLRASLMEVVLVGGTAALLAYYVGTLFAM